jgi:hypothetical protein
MEWMSTGEELRGLSGLLKCGMMGTAQFQPVPRNEVTRS